MQIISIPLCIFQFLLPAVAFEYVCLLFINGEVTGERTTDTVVAIVEAGGGREGGEKRKEVRKKLKEEGKKEKERELEGFDEPTFPSKRSLFEKPMPQAPIGQREGDHPSDFNSKTTC